MISNLRIYEKPELRAKGEFSDRLFLAKNLIDIDMPLLAQWCTEAAAQSQTSAEEGRNETSTQMMEGKIMTRRCALSLLAIISLVSLIASMSSTVSAQPVACSSYLLTQGASTQGANIVVQTDKTSYMPSDSATINVITQIEPGSFAWRDYLVEITTVRFPDGTVKPLNLMGLGYHDLTAVTQINSPQRYDLISPLVIGSYIITARLIQLEGTNVPVTGSDPITLKEQSLVVLKGLLPQALGTAGRVLLETSAVISVTDATPTSLPALSSFGLFLPTGAVVAVDLARNKTNRRKRILTILLAIMLLAIGAPALTTVSADTLTCDKSKFITEGGVEAYVSGTRPDNTYFTSGSFYHHGYPPNSGYCWYAYPNAAGAWTDEAYYSGSWHVLGSNVIYMFSGNCSNGWQYPSSGTTNYSWSSSTHVTNLLSDTDGYFSDGATVSRAVTVPNCS